MMKRKDYQKLAMKVVQLRHTAMLMTSDRTGQSGVQDYTWHSETEESRADESSWDMYEEEE